jgi:hypothetical protein
MRSSRSLAPAGRSSGTVAWSAKRPRWMLAPAGALRPSQAQPVGRRNSTARGSEAASSEGVPSLMVVHPALLVATIRGSATRAAAPPLSGFGGRLELQPEGGDLVDVRHVSKPLRFPDNLGARSGDLHRPPQHPVRIGEDETAGDRMNSHQAAKSAPRMTITQRRLQPSRDLSTIITAPAAPNDFQQDGMQARSQPGRSPPDLPGGRGARARASPEPGREGDVRRQPDRVDHHLRPGPEEQHEERRRDGEAVGSRRRESTRSFNSSVRRFRRSGWARAPRHEAARAGPSHRPGSAGPKVPEARMRPGRSMRIGAG